jgi:hypothetical protein
VRIVRSIAAILTVATAIGLGVTVASANTSAQREQRRDVLQRHSHAHWMSEVVHARDVREARADRWQAADRHANYWLDSRSTATVDWLCIRLHEEGMRPAPGNVFGILGEGGTSYAEQAHHALTIFNDYVPYHRFGGSKWSTAPACGLQ